MPLARHDGLHRSRAGPNRRGRGRRPSVDMTGRPIPLRGCPEGTVGVWVRGLSSARNSWLGEFTKAVAKITDDLGELLAFYDYPAEHGARFERGRLVGRPTEAVAA